MNKPYIILDLDGTISQSGERSIFFYVEPRNYNAAEAGVVFDEVIEPTKKIVDFFVANGFDIVVLTARSERCKSLCEEWLMKNNIPFVDIYMRPANNYVKDYEIKEQLLDQIIEKYGEPYFALDDRQDVIEMFNRRGIFAFAVHRPIREYS